MTAIYSHPSSNAKERFMPSRTHHSTPLRVPQSLLALAVLTTLTQQSATALDLAQSPPGTVEPYVAPNLIISIDDSGSMGFRLDTPSTTDATNNTEPTCTTTEPKQCTWPDTSRRMNVLKHALTQIFDDKTLLDDKKIRFGWQAMWNNGNNISEYKNLNYWYGQGNNPGQNKTPGANDVGSSNLNAKNNIRILDETHRGNFKEFLKYLLPQNGTPSHLMFKQADDYLRKKNSNDTAPLPGGPWASKPGDATSTEFLGCRRNYHIMMTDGRWNGTVSGGNIESVDIKLPDGTQYTANSDQTKIYYDNYPDTLSDWAFYSWSRNLQPSLYDKTNLTKQISQTSEYRKADATEKFGNTNLLKYWNPKYNPATWPHLVTYTIGFSEDAITWPGASSITKPTQTVPFGYDGSFPGFVNGNPLWPNMANGENVRALDLWHAAINGRGRFYAVKKGEDLEAAFREIIGTINSQAEPDRSSVAISGTSAERKPVGTFITFNEPKEAWRGGIKSFIVSNTGQTAAWGGKSTADILDEATTTPENRVILTWNDELQRGAPFKWANDGINMSQAQKNLLHMQSESALDTRGEARLDYIRGDRTQEGSASTNFRTRKSRQGDIVNSSIWYTGMPVSNYSHKGYSAFLLKYKNRNPVIYAGGNDGMLHGFSSANGKEVIAYIPRGTYQNLARLTWKSFDDNHKYFVDGSPMTGDVDIANRSNENYTPDWRTFLLGTLGGGGKGYFVLDVTNSGTSDSTPTASNFSESNATNLVVMDKTMSALEQPACATPTDCLNEPNADIGHIFSTPSTEETNPLKTTQIALLNNNRWAAIMGNGYNSKNGRPVLLIQYLDGNKELLRIPATSATETACTPEQLAANKSYENTCHNVSDNGLSTPRLVDINGDNRPDVVYAGDLKGNIWKFLIGSKSSDGWGVAFNGKPLYTAVGGTQGSSDSRTMRQSITAAPTVRSNDRSYTTGSGNTLQTHRVGGMMVSFGTGRNVTPTDPADADVQTLYSVVDNTRYVVTRDASDQKNYVSIHAGDASKSIPVPTTAGLGATNLAQQKVDTANKYSGSNASVNRDFWTMNTTGSTAVNWATHKGWYMDFPETGERLLKPLDLYDGSNILAVYSQIPAKGSNARADVESCESTAVDSERQYLTLINIMDGQRPTVQLMDLNGDGMYDPVADKYASRQRIEKGAHTRLVSGKHIKDIGKEEEFNLARMPEQSMRPSWRQMK